MNQQLIDDIWLKVMREAPISKIPELFAALVAEECAKVVTGFDPHGDWVKVDGAAAIADEVRAKFPLPKAGA